MYLIQDCSRGRVPVYVHTKASACICKPKKKEQKDTSSLRGACQIDTSFHQCRPFPVLALQYKGRIGPDEDIETKESVHGSGEDRFEMPFDVRRTKEYSSLPNILQTHFLLS
jgi:hypothetical protein